MKVDNSVLLLAATDLSTFSSCRRATLLDREVAYDRLPRPFRPEDPAMELLQERGRQHEARYRAFLENRYGELAFVVPSGPLETLADWRIGTERTSAAMRVGHRIIFQAPLSDGRWHGRADFLERVDHDLGAQRSLLGDYHYRAVDTKLAQKPRGSAILQLCVYSEIVALLQGMTPEHMVVVSPAGAPTSSSRSPVPKVEEFRTADFISYFRRIRGRLETLTAETNVADVYPEVCEQCDVCSWWSLCNERRRADDHLSFVAGISRRDQKLLESADVKSLKRLAALALPMAERPRKLREETLQKLQQQAKLQYAAIGSTPTYTLLTPVVEGKGLARLPEPSPGDIFFDIEADRYATDGSFNYLIGWMEIDQAGDLKFHKRWAENRGQERLSFETFVDRLRERLEEFPDLHAYHFAPFEKTALGELAGRYASREDEVDDLLRQNVLCDLLPIVKQGLQAGVERYSLKDLEQFYKFKRNTDLREAALARRLYELAREGGGASDLPDLATTIENYNREDCESTKLLRDWLERRRAELQSEGHLVARPIPEEGKESKDLSDWLHQVEQLRSRLLSGLPVDGADRTDGHNARQLLADVLDWHRRKEKPTWWEYFRIRRLTSEECFQESGPIGNLQAERHIGTVDKSQGYEYAFPPQDYKLRVGDQVECPVTKQSVGEVVELRREVNAVVVKRRGTLGEPPVALSKVPQGFRVESMQQALAEIADSLAATGFGLPTRDDGWGPPDLTYSAARAMLLREPPRLAPGVGLHSVGDDPSAAAVRIASQLRQTVLPIQGPPGAGKSHTGSRMILELLLLGKRVGITATGHKVIGNLLKKVHEAADEAGVVVRSLQKVTITTQGFAHERNAVTTKSGDKLKAEVDATRALDGKPGKLLAGTQYFWSSPIMRQSVDVLIVDEAGQFSLANALAVTVSSDSLVLLGDPQQLAQPDQGSHPPGAGISALEHMLNGADTISKDRGIFLDQTWRLPPSIARFTSAHFYSDRLKAHPDCARQIIRRTREGRVLVDAGILFTHVEHEGNVSFCPEEADRVVELVREFLCEPATWVDRDGNEHRFGPEHVLIVAPYNAQVQLISETLEVAALGSVSVGTVDKFQGQEAPLVIYSMTTSSTEDAPRGLDFLFELERLNVATSRAQAVVIVVASPRLLDAECKMPKQMRLVNGLCGAVEMAREQARSLVSLSTTNPLGDK
jgi:predicted RecB family nuclease